MEKKKTVEGEIEAPKPEKEKEARVVEVATEYGIAVELPDGTVVNFNELLVGIWNKLDNIEKTLTG